MKSLAGMVVGSVLAAIVAVAAAGSRGATGVAAPVFGGMIGPLAAAVVTWVIVRRAFQRDPASVTRVMMTAFMAKALFFAGYVVVMVKVIGLDPLPFVVSFAAFFLGLYAVQAVMLSRLFRGGAPRVL